MCGHDRPAIPQYHLSWTQGEDGLPQLNLSECKINASIFWSQLHTPLIPRATFQRSGQSIHMLISCFHQPRQADGRLPGQVHYESLCMRAVNQSIGRAIRHSRDYACIMLADVRYERPSVTKHLPQWIASQVQVCKTFGQGFAAIRKVYRAIVCTKLQWSRIWSSFSCSSSTISHETVSNSLILPSHKNCIASDNNKFIFTKFNSWGGDKIKI